MIVGGRPKRTKAKARRAKHTPGHMNKLERRYAHHLDELLAKGEILAWWFEPLKLRLASNTYYTPDFLVVTAHSFLELHETKGGPWEDDARVKIKVAAEMYPVFRFAGVRRDKGAHEWTYETFGPPEEEETDAPPSGQIKP